MIEELKKNIKTEKEILKEIALYSEKFAKAQANEKKLIEATLDSLKNSLKIVNSSIPEILESISIAKPIPKIDSYQSIPGQHVGKMPMQKISYEKKDKKIEITLSPRLKKKFLEELSISEDLIKRITRKEGEDKDDFYEFKAARGYPKFANKYFLDIAIDRINKGEFRQIGINLRKANIELLFETYVSMIFMTTMIALFVGIAITFFMMFFKVSYLFPFFSFYEGNYLIRLASFSWIILAIPIISFLAMYFYPGLERKSVEFRIDQELPFAVIHMAAISGSGISPNELFKIIGMSNEYPSLKKEIRKIINQINLYGYDLVTSLNNISKNTPSEKLSELFTGLATTITSGGELKPFFEKRAESLLLWYKLEREKYTRASETFMDIYISIVIAAPMILMILLIMINVSGLGLGLTPNQLSVAIVSVIALLNFLFLGFLNAKQPSY